MAVNLVIAVVLLALAAAAAVLRKTYNVVPPHELKRQAAAGNQLAVDLYRAVGHGRPLRALLWLILALSGSAGLVLLVNSLPVWLSFIAVAVILWAGFSWLPNTRVTGAGVRLTRLLSPLLSRLLHYLDTPLNYLAAVPAKRFLAPRSDIYELQDLVDVLELQAGRSDNRISITELDLVRQVLRFRDYKVRDVLRPRTQVKVLAVTDPIGPILLDELHASGQTSFPVKRSARTKEIVGTLHLTDVGIHSKGTVQDHMTEGVTFTHESDNLADALHVFYQTKQQLFIVINSFEEYVGVLTLEDILHVIVGRPEPDEKLGSHDNSTIVAARHTSKTIKALEPDESVELAESPETVVE